MVSSILETISPCFFPDCAFNIAGIDPFSSEWDTYTTVHSFQPVALIMYPPTSTFPRTTDLSSGYGYSHPCVAIKQVSPSLQLVPTLMNSRSETGQGAEYLDLSTVVSYSPLITCRSDCSLSCGLSFFRESDFIRNAQTLSAENATLVSPLAAMVPSISILNIKQGVSAIFSHLGWAMMVLNLAIASLAIAMSSWSVGFSACIMPYIFIITSCVDFIYQLTLYCVFPCPMRHIFNHNVAFNTAIPQY